MSRERFDGDHDQRRAMLRRLSEAQNHRCAYCGVRFGAEFRHWHWELTRPTIDHVIARAHGGTDAWENLVAACYRCNRARGLEDAWEFFARRGWLNAKDRRLGYDFIERAIRKAQPLAPHIARKRMKEPMAKKPRGQKAELSAILYVGSKKWKRRRAIGAVRAAARRQK